MSEAAVTGRHISTSQAAFIGVGGDGRGGDLLAARCGGRGRRAAVWLSFLLAGGIAALQGYSFAKLGARYPSAGGLLEYVNRGFGDGHVATIVAWLVLRRQRDRDGDGGHLVRQLRELRVRRWRPGRGRRRSRSLLRRRDDRPQRRRLHVVARVQSLVVVVVIGILAVFAVVDASANIEPGAARARRATRPSATSCRASR